MTRRLHERAVLKKYGLWVLALAIPSLVQANTFTVSTTANTGAGSLRQAITDANAAGAGPHSITFTTSGTIALASALPAINVSGVTLDGAGAITISGTGSINLLSLGAGASNATIKGVTLQNTNGNGINMTGGLTGVTIQDIVERSTLPTVRFSNGINIAGNSTNLTVKNVRMTQIKTAASTPRCGIAFNGNATGFTAENLRVTSNLGAVIYVTGSASNWNIKNSTFDLDEPNTTVVGGRGISFNTLTGGTLSNITIDSCQFHDASQSIYVINSPLITNMAIRKCVFDHLDGSGFGAGYDYYQPNGGNPINGLTIDSCSFNGDVSNTATDVPQAVYTAQYKATNLNITNSTFTKYRSNGVYIFSRDVNNSSFNGNTFKNCGSGSVNTGGLRLFTDNYFSKTGPVTVSNNTFKDNNGSAIYMSGNSTIVSNCTLSNNTITGTLTTNGAIVLSSIQKVRITQNLIYSNVGRGIALLSGGNCSYAGAAYTPQLTSSVETSPGVYSVTVQMPAICGTGNCTMEVFASEASITGIGGQHYIQTNTNLPSGLTTLTGVTGPYPEFTTAPYGYFTATLRVQNNNCGTSEFSSKLAISTIGPAGVNGASVWVNPDFLSSGNLVNGTGWEDITGNNRHYKTVSGAVPSVTGGVNYNNHVKFTGTQSLMQPNFVSAYTAGAVFTVARSAASSYSMYDYGTISRPSAYGTTSVHNNFGTDNKLGWNPVTKVIADGKPGTTITGRSVDVQKWNIYSTYSATGKWGMDFNGGQQAASTNTNTPVFYATAYTYLGSDIIGGFNGDVAEHALYARLLTPLEKQRINSYLAIKYGITLSQNYIASDSTTIWWNRNSSLFFSKGIAGIAKDVTSILHQKQSAMASIPDVVTIGMGNALAGTNALNAASIQNDRSAFVWGTDSAATLYNTPYVTPYSSVRMNRRWKVQKTNWADTTIIVRLQGGSAIKRLLISSDSTFSSGVQSYALNDTGAVILNSSAFPNNAYFTFSNAVIAPACVTAGIQGWYRADDVNATINRWADFSGNDKHATQATAASQPVLNANVTNYHPAFNFDGSNDYMDIASNLGINGTNNFTVLSVSTREAVGSNRAILSQQGNITNNFISYFASTNKYALGNTPSGIISSTGTYATANIPYLNATTRSGNTFSLYTNGGADGSGTGAFTFTNNNLRIGNRAASADLAFDGSINEVIVYNRQLTATELSQVQSYLAFKYGITLSQAVPTDYVSSNTGVTMWKASDNAGYVSDIIGIGKDHCSRLSQKQSRSVNAGSLLTLAVGDQIAADNKTNTDSISNDLSFFFTGSNNLDATKYSVSVSGTDATVRLPRVWKVDRTNWTDKNITLKFNTGVKSAYLLVSSNAGFSTIDQELPINAADSTITLNSSLLPDGAYFTVGKAVKGPGFVNAGVAMWLRADDGTAAPSYWEDYSGNARDAAQATAGNQPVFVGKSTNYNPGLNFDGTDDFLDFSDDLGITGTNSFTVVSVSTRKTLGTDDAVLAQQGVTTGNFASYYTAANKYAVGSTSVGSMLSTGTYVSMPYLNATTRSGNTFSLYTNGAADGGGTATYNYNNTNMRLGARATSADMAFNGHINEVAVYDHALTAAEMQQVQSYMAYKYGLTLSQATATDYIATDGSTKMWDAAAGTVFKNNIAGIGRDDRTDLYQKQSASVNDSLLTVSIGGQAALTNQDNTATFDNDLSFMSWGDNGAAATLSTPISGGSSTVRMTRVWKMQKVNFTDADITVKPGKGGIKYLLVNTTDSTFAGGTTVEYTLNASGAVTINSSLIPNGAFVTFGTRLVGPGCVNTNILTWLRADGVASGSIWGDFSGNGKDATQSAAGSQPVLNTNSLNFNPALSFDGTDDWVATPSNLASDYVANTFFIVNKPQDVSTGDFIGAGNSVSSYLGFGATSGGGMRYYETGASVATATGLNTVDVPFITAVTQTVSASGINIYRNGSVITTGTLAANLPNASAALEVGRRAVAAGGSAFYDGELQEVVAYNRVLLPFEMNKVNSYLGLKYGFTISGGTVDYVASDWDGTTGTKMWTADASYKYRITGIGRDDCDELYQKQSRSSDTGLVTMAVGNSITATNTDNASEILSNNSYLVFADNNAPALYTTAVAGTDVNYRMARTWKTDKTNWTDSTITLKLHGKSDGMYLLISTDPAFGTVSQELPLNSSDSTVNFNTSLLPDGAYFTFGRKITVPGGVAGASVWMRANAGTNTTTDNTAVNSWLDSSPYENDLTQAIGTRQPSFRNNGTDNINFNPVLNFDGGDVLSKTPGMLGTASYTGAALFMVNNANNLTAARPFWEPTSANFLGLTNTSATSYSFNYGPAAASGTSGIAAGITYLFSANSGVSSHLLTRNAATIVNSATGTPNYTGNNSALSVGAEAAATSPFTGRIPEVIGYTQNLSAGDMQKLNSYLAIKYGLTLDQTTPYNYLATDNTVIWDATANAAYKYSIAGIGRDDLEDLQQKQSRSSDTTRIRVAVGLGALAETNTDNTGVIGLDKSYLVWGDDNGSASFTTPVTGNSSVNFRMGRVWKAQHTGAVGAVQVAFPISCLPNPANSYLVLSNDATFDGTDEFVALNQVTINGKKHYAANTNLGNGQFFTVAALIKSPGGVGATSLWMRADEGIDNTVDNTPVDEWTDYASQVNNGIQTTAASQPSFLDNATDNANFNPMLKFDGTADNLVIDINRLPMGATARTVIGFGKPAVVTGVRSIVGWGTSTTNLQYIGLGANAAAGVMSTANATHPLSSAAFWTAGTHNELFATYATGTNNSRLYSKMKQLATGTLTLNTTGTLANIGSGNGFWNGNIGEVIVFDRALDSLERQRVSTYLAIKYGYTIDQTSPIDYVATDGTTNVWDATANATYKNSITGIGRDDIEGLDQRQSSNIDATRLQVTLGMDAIATTNNTNQGSIAQDRSYLVWGDDNTAANAWSTTDVPVGRQRITRVWKVQETGTIGDVMVRIPASTSALTNKLPAEVSNKAFLLISNSTTFATGATEVPMTLNGTNWEASYDFGTGAYFTFATADACGATTPMVLAAGSVETVTSPCNVGLWTRYRNPSNLNEVLVSIDANGNTFNPTSITVDVSGTYDSSRGTAADHVASSATDSAKLSMRMVNVVAPGTYTVNGGVKVRIYYDPSEFGGNFPVFGPNNYTGWFKHPNHTKTTVLGALTATGLTGMTAITPDTTGFEEGVAFVEFRNITSFSTFGFISSTITPVVLPVTLKSFGGKMEDCKAALRWETASEQNMAKTEVEMSTDGRGFTKVAELKAMNSPVGAAYNYTHETPFKNKAYFRLRLVSNTGKADYSHIIALNPCQEVSVVMSPNPVSGALKISGLSGKSQIQLFDNMGRQLQSISTTESTYLLPMQQYTGGTYIIRVVGEDNTVFNQRILKVH